jgi:hypothetical protein
MLMLAISVVCHIVYSYVIPGTEYSLRPKIVVQLIK